MGLPGVVRIVDDVPTAFARHFHRCFDERPSERFTVALSGGDTARRCYETLAASAVPVDWTAVDVFWGDERCVPADSPDSNQLLGREALLDRVGPVGSVHPMDCGVGPAVYERLVTGVGRLDLVHLGLGPDGHTASLFPSSPALDADPTRLVVTNTDPRGVNPHERMTFTFAGIALARQVVVTVAGDSKADAFARIVGGEDLPGSRIRADEIVWLVDPAALASTDRASLPLEGV